MSKAEINLVPDVKNEMIRAIRLRNWILFGCIVVSLGVLGINVVLGLIYSGQKIALADKENRVEMMKEKIDSYEDLAQFLTLQGQLNGLGEIASNRTDVTRVFTVLSALIPTSGDEVLIDEVSLDVESGEMTLSAQANALTSPYIDYTVLESFKKSMSYLTYDYGDYVTADGDVIPSYCMVESGADGSTYNDAERGIYAYWKIGVSGCYEGEDYGDYEIEQIGGELNEGETVNEYSMVKIWRTPQVEEWYASEKMDEMGVISGIEHFESACINYSVEVAADGTVSYTESNETCKLVPDGLTVGSSSNSRGEDGELVLSFDATLTIAPEVFMSSNKHVLAFGASGRHNVTDSFVQIQNMFVAPATDCSKTKDNCKEGN